MKPTYPYTVKSGDWLAKIAEEHGTTVGEIWSHPDNAELRAKRGSPDVLYPGDVVHIPYDPDSAQPPPPSIPPTPIPPIPPVPPGPPVPPIPPVPPGVPPGLPLPTLGKLALLVDSDPFQHFDVLAFHGTEHLSGAYRFEVTALTPTAPLPDMANAMVGRRAAFLFSTQPASQRLVRGVLSRIRLLDRPAESGLQTVRFTVVPHLALLRHRRRSRIFQHRTVAEIAERVLREAGIETRTSFVRPPPTRVYCTQYEETDYDFVRRILAEAGCYFLLNDPPLDTPVETLLAVTIGGVSGVTIPSDLAGRVESWLIADSPVAYPALQGLASSVLPGGATERVPFLPTNLVGAEPAIWQFEREARLGTTAASYSEYAPANPNFGQFAATKLSPPEGALPRPATPHGGSVELEHYEHHARYLETSWEDGRREPDRIIVQNRRRTDVARGTGNVPSFAAGRKFMLAGHPSDELNREYVLTRVHHQGALDGLEGGQRIYQCRFECAPSDVTYASARPRRKCQMAMLTATVVGPAGEDIYVDPLGRVRVRFPWDRESPGDDTSSCWVRTMQAVAGDGWGTQFIPRVGTEVVVTFEGGDIDKPLVLGSVYNGTHPPPFHLPSERTRSGLRTRSSPTSDNHNELSFEDQSGAEEIYLRAARDFRAEITHDRTLTVGQSSHVTVDGSHSEHIAAHARLEVRKDRTVAVGGDATREVEGTETHTVLQGLHQRVSGNLDWRVQGMTISHHDGDARREHHGNYLERTHGHDVRIVGTADTPRSRFNHVEGRSSLYATDRVEISLMAVPHPVAHAGIMFLLLSMEAVDAYLSNEPQDTEITSGRVNVHIRNLIKLGGSPRNPLSVFLTDTERDALAEVELICNAQDIKHPAAGSTFDPLGIVALDVQKLRQLGFSLEEIKELTGCPWLTVEELQ